MTINLNVQPIAKTSILSTYRLQFNARFTFQDATRLVSYFSSLGISHLYASPIFKARSESMHGYDIVDYNALNPEIGTEEDFYSLIHELHMYEMGLILDMVPNHMAIGLQNAWWVDILENGVLSKYAAYFDINWTPSQTLFKNKIFLPVLEQPLQEAFKNKKLKIVYEKGFFSLKYGEMLLPTASRSWKSILEFLQLELTLESQKQSLCRILEDLENIDVLELKEKKSKKNLIKNELQLLFNDLDLTTWLEKLNAGKSSSEDFDFLEKFLEMQNYHLCEWKTTNDKVNYRRFFDISDYASIKVESPEVFHAVHKTVFKWMENQLIDGLRIDHIDGLWDPEQYVLDLHRFSPRSIPYLIVEKILTATEQLRSEWKIEGSVGYDFLNQVNNLFAVEPNKKKFLTIYENFTGLKEEVDHLKYECKKLILQTSLATEMNFLSESLEQIAAENRFSYHLDLENLKQAFIEVIACLPVYRTYIRAYLGKIHVEDRNAIQAAVKQAKIYHSSMSPTVYEFIESVLLIDCRQSKEKAKSFIMHFQQLTGAMMAKGLEDTAFYRYYPLSSLNEVGQNLGEFGISISNFHKENLERHKKFPFTMLTTTTHDTKRSEDVRARLNVLSEIPEQWENSIKKWCQLNEKHKTKNEQELIPDKNEEYLIYQTLLGLYPLNGEIEPSLIDRLKKFIEKAIKEAKIHSNWIDLNQIYLQNVKCFIEKILDPLLSEEFLKDFSEFFKLIRDKGLLNSLSQLILKLTSPGVPDIYQGCELWNFTLVDPDNRGPVNYDSRVEFFGQMNFESVLRNSKQNSYDGKIKLAITQNTLLLRKNFPLLFTEGDYLPLNIEGPLCDSIIAFARRIPEKIALTLTCRFFHLFMKDFNKRDNSISKNLFLIIPEELLNKKYRDIYTQKSFIISETRVPLKEFFESFPFAVLESIEIC